MGKEQAGISKMAGLGTIVNVAGILAGCGVGLLLKGGLPKRLQDTISSAVGLCVVFVGITGASIRIRSFLPISQLVLTSLNYF